MDPKLVLFKDTPEDDNDDCQVIYDRANGGTKPLPARQLMKPSTSAVKPGVSAASEKNKLHLCQICDRPCKTMKALKRHVTYHLPDRPFQCDHVGCAKAFKTLSDLKRHQLIHQPKTIECKSCGNKFTSKYGLKNHVTRNQQCLKWNCALCQQVFTSEDDFIKHSIKIHTINKI